jgi:hypothetical protein
MPRRPTVVLAPDPSPTPRLLVAPLGTRPPTRHTAIKASVADRRPSFTLAILPPRQGRAQRPTSPPLPLVHPSQPERRRLLQVYRCHHHLFPPLVSAALEALSAKWPWPSPSSLPPRATRPCRCRQSSSERRHPRRNVVTPPHPPSHRRPTPLVSYANTLLAWRPPLTILMLAPPTALHLGRRRNYAGRATTHGHHAVTALCARTAPTGVGHCAARLGQQWRASG